MNIFYSCQWKIIFHSFCFKNNKCVIDNRSVIIDFSFKLLGKHRQDNIKNKFKITIVKLYCIVGSKNFSYLSSCLFYADKSYLIAVFCRH